MKKIKLDAAKLQLKKERITNLTDEQMGRVVGGEPLTGITEINCCLPTTATGGYCPPPNTPNCTVFNQTEPAVCNSPRITFGCVSVASC